MHSLRGNLALVAICLYLSAQTGCSTQRGIMANILNPSFGTSEQKLQVKSPADRAKELKALAKSVKKMPAAEQQHTVEQLAKDLQNESDPMLRRQILRTLGACPPASATPIIATALSDQDVETRRTACLALGDRGGKDAVQELTRVITTDASVDVRLAAVRAMGTTGDASAVAPLAEVMGDADPAVKARAYESITAVSGRDYGTDVQAWRQYAQTGTTTVPEVSFTAKLRKMFY